MQNTLGEDRGQNLFTTSTGTAHHWRPGYFFPSSNFKVRNCLYELILSFFSTFLFLTLIACTYGPNTYKFKH